MPFIRRPILVQGNRFFRTRMSAILVEDDARRRYESGPVRDLAIKENSFFECGEPVIKINPENAAHAGAVHKNIRIEDNVFTLKGRSAIRAKSTDGLVISGNRFRMRNQRTPPAADLVKATDTTGLVIESNTVEPFKESATTPPDTFSFEEPDVAPGSYSNGSPAGWTFVSGVNGGVEDIADTRFGVLGPAGAKLDALGGDGDQVGYINIGNSGTASATSANLGAIAPDTTYTLTIAFAQRASGDRHPDGSFGLLAGGTPLGNVTPVTGQSLPTGFTDFVYTWTSPGANDPLIGQPLQIRMNFSYSSAAGGWQQAQFDHIRIQTAH